MSGIEYAEKKVWETLVKKKVPARIIREELDRETIQQLVREAHKNGTLVDYVGEDRAAELLRDLDIENEN